MSQSSQSKSNSDIEIDTYTCQQKKNCYGEVANTYNRVRPSYPQEIVDRVVELATLPEEAKILEVGCGPGTATKEFAKLGFSMVSLDPSPEACQLARHNCTQYKNVEIVNSSFEEWELQPQQFDAFLAATSFHWISSEIRYRKSADALKDKGALILLWNAAALPEHEVSQLLNEVYQVRTPSLAGYERKKDEENLKKLGQAVIDSGRFQDLVSEQLTCELTYSIDDYLALLSTYSPYIALDPQKQNSLFQDLRKTLENNCGTSIELSYISAFHFARKI